jgi:16S rRNA (guanine966-N2)-methyltransferase
MFGFEALSRGASEVVFVDNARSVAAALERTADDLGLSSATMVLTLDARTALNRLLQARQLFDVLFLDPPYDSDLLRPWLAEGSAPGLMASEGLLIVERSSTASECRPPASLERVLHRTYGHTTVEMFRKETR